MERQRLRQDAADIHAGLLTTGREAEAKSVADQAIEASDDPAMRRTLVETAIRAGQPRAWHLAFLGGDQADLAEKIHDATGK